MTIENTRMDAIEKRMDKYDVIISELRDIVIELRTRGDTNFKWLSGLIGVSCVFIGGFIGHFIH